MRRYAGDAIRDDVRILRDAYDHMTAFGRTDAMCEVGTLLPPRESSWVLADFMVNPADRPGSTLEVWATDEARTSDSAEAWVGPSRGKKTHPLFVKHRLPFAEPRDPDRGAGSPKVFLVHGRNHGPRDTIKAFLLEQHIKPVILEEQPNRGATLIEKLEQNSGVDYAIVLLTPEDRCVPAGSTTPVLRARQNVILELGYLFGVLGRDRVAAIVVGDLEQPSDVRGLAYIPFDEAGGWKVSLGRELRAAGFAVDLNLTA